MYLKTIFGGRGRFGCQKHDLIFDRKKAEHFIFLDENYMISAFLKKQNLKNHKIWIWAKLLVFEKNN